MKKKFLIILSVMLSSCTWNMIQISVLPDGNYSIVYESNGNRLDIDTVSYTHLRAHET